MHDEDEDANAITEKAKTNIEQCDGALDVE